MLGFGATVATALTVYGIETQYFHHQRLMNLWVATALTVYGIETVNVKSLTISLLALQQHLPFTVLKLI